MGYQPHPNDHVNETWDIRKYPQRFDSAPTNGGETSYVAIYDNKSKDILPRLGQNQAVTHLLIANLSEEDLQVIASLRTLTHLRILNSRVLDFSPLERLPALRYLMLDTNGKINSLHSLSVLRDLVGLQIHNFSGVNSLEPIEKLSKLKYFAFEGTLHKNFSVESLIPASALLELEVLHVTGVRFRDENLSCVAAISKLQELKVGCFFSAEQFARLSGMLPQCKCMWFQPSPIASPSKCKGGHQKRMLSGKGQRDLCPECDAKKYENFIKQFEEWRRLGIE